MATEDRQERRRIAENYAQALYELASEKGKLDALREEFSMLRELLDKNPQLVQILEAPTIKAEKRQQLVSQFKY